MTWVNARMERLFGLPAGAMIGKSPETLFAATATERPGVDAPPGEFRLARADGSLFWARLAVRRADLEDAGGARVWTIEDITQTAETENRRRLSDAIFDHATDGILVCNPDRRIVSVNSAFEREFGYETADILGQGPEFFSSGRQGEAAYETLWQSVEASGYWEGETWNRRKTGEVFREWQTVTAIRGGDGAVQHYLLVLSDPTRGRHDADAYYDPLTGLPDRRLINDRLHQALAQASVAGEKVGILVVDILDLRAINERHGVAAGDAVLATFADRFRALLRDRDAIGRLEGDDFLVVLSAVSGAGAAGLVVNRVLEAAGEPVPMAQAAEIQAGACVGAALFPDDGDTAADLIRNARIAAGRAQRKGGGYRFFTTDMNARAAHVLRLEHELEGAIERQEFVVHYQPKVSLQSGRIAGMEALVRWQHPERGLIGPDEFIGLAEQSGLIVALGEWVLAEACRQARAWMDDGVPPLLLAVNLSPVQLMRADLVNTIARILRDTGYPPAGLELEITESALLDNVDEVRATLEGVRKLGIGLAADDFGTGYSSLRYLKDFPFTAIKIDRSFVAAIGDGDEAGDGAKLSAAVISIAQSLDLRVVAEGPENQAQLAFLRQKWCDEIQGPIFSDPLPAEDFRRLIAEHRHL